MAVIDPATDRVEGRIATGGTPIGLAVAGDSVWVADHDGSVVRVDASSRRVVARVALGAGPQALTVAFGRVWIASESGSVFVVDPATNRVAREAIPIGSDADAVASTAHGVWAAALYSNRLVRLDPQSGRALATVSVPGQPSGLLVAGDSLWVSLYDHHLVLELDRASGAIRRRFRVGEKPRELVFDGTSVWAANQGSDSVSKITS